MRGGGGGGGCLVVISRVLVSQVSWIQFPNDCWLFAFLHFNCCITFISPDVFIHSTICSSGSSSSIEVSYIQATNARRCAAKAMANALHNK